MSDYGPNARHHSWHSVLVDGIDPRDQAHWELCVVCTRAIGALEVRMGRYDAERFSPCPGPPRMRPDVTAHGILASRARECPVISSVLAAHHAGQYSYAEALERAVVQLSIEKETAMRQLMELMELRR